MPEQTLECGFVIQKIQQNNAFFRKALDYADDEISCYFPVDLLHFQAVLEKKYKKLFIDSQPGEFISCLIVLINSSAALIALSAWYFSASGET